MGKEGKLDRIDEVLKTHLFQDPTHNPTDVGVMLVIGTVHWWHSNTFCMLFQRDARVCGLKPGADRMQRLILFLVVGGS